MENSIYILADAKTSLVCGLKALKSLGKEAAKGLAVRVKG
jgi:hypothetical protein